MKYIFTHVEEIKKRIANKKIILFLDYDGTLVKIKKKPELAIIDLETKNLLKKLNKKFIVCIISGRELKDIKNLIKIRKIIYIGNHGFESNFFKIKFKKNIISKIFKELKKNLKIKGIIFEDKKATISVHYRLVEKEKIKELKKIFYEIVKKYKGIKIREGRKVLEVVPNINWNKGRACLFLLKKFNAIFDSISLQNSSELCRFNAYPIYIGDDKTDKDAFKLLKGITISVGKSNAEFYVKSIKEVKKFLNKILKNFE